jgi:hypothetical protein
MRLLTPAKGKREVAAVLGAAALVMAMAVACAAEPSGQTGGASPAPEASQSPDIRHLVPEPDSVGPQPTRFAWTAVEGAESYMLRVWNEVDVRIVSETGITTTSVDVSGEDELPLGTYFWSVVAMRNGRPVAESGLAAFVVMK